MLYLRIINKNISIATARWICLFFKMANTKSHFLWVGVGGGGRVTSVCIAVVGGKKDLGISVWHPIHFKILMKMEKNISTVWMREQLIVPVYNSFDYVSKCTLDINMQCLLWCINIIIVWWLAVSFWAAQTLVYSGVLWCSPFNYIFQEIWMVAAQPVNLGLFFISCFFIIWPFFIDSFNL